MISAIVPTRNEARALPVLLGCLGPEADEVIVCDGGSTDGSPDIARRLGAVVVEGARGRGPQLNAGVAVARGSRLWFLHADTGVAPGSGAALRAATTRWGCFATRIGSDDPRLRFTARWMTRRARQSGSCSGDMAMWMDAALVSELGGFRPLPAFEDLDLSDRARAYPWSVLEPAVTTSARRWELEGTTRTIALLWALRLGYRLGVDPNRLAAAYASSPRYTRVARPSPPFPEPR